jgi:hypothetical protein
LNTANTRISDSISGFYFIRSLLRREYYLELANNCLGDLYESFTNAELGSFPAIEIPTSLKARELSESTANTGAAFKFTFNGLGAAL